MFTGEEEHLISFEAAGEITKRYRERNNHARIAAYFSKEAILSVLQQSNCVGIRIYYGLDSDLKAEPIIVGVLENEDDIVGQGKVCLDMSLPCPSRCSSDNILNS